MRYIISDIETNGLLDTVSKFWCAWTYDSEGGVWAYHLDVNEYFDFLDRMMSDGYKLVFHNGIAYDIPCLKKLTGRRFKNDPWNHVLDTLVLGRLVWAEMKDMDISLIKRGVLPSKLMGSHSLKAYGYRLGLLKGDYGDKEDAWDTFNEEMLEYCKRDVEVTLKLFLKIMDKGYPDCPIDLEHRIAWVIAKQERNGYTFDMEKATKLYAELSGIRAELHQKLVDTFGSWEVLAKEAIAKRNDSKRGRIKGQPYKVYKTVTFNPSSTQHIAKVLMERGWQPEVFTPTGEVKVDEETLKSCKLPEVADIKKYLMIQKRISQLAEGSEAWLKNVKDDGKIHGYVNPNGAVTGRATHAHPNVAQVPAINVEYGAECRELFKAPEGWYQVGVDASGLELRCLSHYLYPFDDGAYAHEVINGDIHTTNQKSAGLPTRADAKTFIYGFLYGAGDEKIGKIIGKDASVGKKIKKKFLEATPALASLRDSITNTLCSEMTWTSGGQQRVKWIKRVHPASDKLDATKCLVGLDGRLVKVRSPHSALNTLLQSAGALLCKKWVCLTEENLRKAGYHHGDDFQLMAWIHDEIQIACRTEEIANRAIEIAQESMRETQKFFNFRVQLDTEGKIGRNWKDCH